MNQTDLIDWMIEHGEPWVKYNVYTQLLHQKGSCKTVKESKKALMAHPLVQELIDDCMAWPKEALKSHKNAKHPLHKLKMLTDFGLRSKDDGIQTIIEKIVAQRSDDGAFETLTILPKMWGGSNEPEWIWILCDAPVLLHAILGLGDKKTKMHNRAYEHLLRTASKDGWLCQSSIPKMSGPGKKTEGCPYATLLCLRALALSEEHIDSNACRNGTELLLSHWEHQKEKKLKMFGIGTDFRKLKYPMVFYDLLHVLEVLSQFPWVHGDSRFREMFELLLSKANKEGQYTPESVWMAFKGYDFAQKKVPSPTLTFMVERIRRRVEESVPTELA